MNIIENQQLENYEQHRQYEEYEESGEYEQTKQEEEQQIYTKLLMKYDNLMILKKI
jgi:hypothetical protein